MINMVILNICNFTDILEYFQSLSKLKISLKSTTVTPPTREKKFLNETFRFKKIIRQKFIASL